MIKKFKGIFFLISFAIFTFLTINHYFSEENMIHTNKSRSAHLLKSYNKLPLLKNDTSNIIVYTNDLEEFKKTKKKKILGKIDI